jgi:CheY-like chemotaxis protein
MTLEKAPTQDAAGPPAAAPLAGRRLLVVDDVEWNRRAMCAHLHAAGAVAEEASSVAMAVEMIRCGAFDLILVDEDMGDTDAEEAGRAIRAEPRGVQTPMVLMAPISGWRTPVRALGGFAGVLTKPIRRSQLLDLACSAIAATTRTAAPAPAGERLALGLRVLLAEDNPVNQKVALAMLTRLGCDATSVGNGAGAVTATMTERFDVVLMDVQMPGMDGLEATAIIRERERDTGDHVPIIAMTAHAMASDRERCLAAGMDGFVTKPVRTDELAKALLGYARLGVHGGEPRTRDDAAADEPPEGRES